MKIYIIWFIGVFAWNFGFPNATPLEDVIVAVIFIYNDYGIKKIFKK